MYYHVSKHCCSLFLLIPDDQKNDLGVRVQVEYDNGVVLPSARGWVSCNKVHPSYSDAESLLHFLDKYTMIIVGGPKAMGAYCKINKGKTLLDRVTVSDIAYGFLVYENSYDVWMEEIDKLDTHVLLLQRRRHSNTLLRTSTMYNEGPVFRSTLMVGHQKAMNALMLFVPRFEI